MTEELVSRNVATMVRAPRLRPRKIVPWSSEEARRFLESARNDADSFYAVFVLVLVLGLRKGEVLGLSWLAVDMQAREVTIDQQLQRDSDLTMVEYQVLAMLSNSPDRTRRMSLLAQVANVSMSHLSRIVNRLEHRGLVRREPDPTDGRFTNAILTDKGVRTLADAAPGHVAHVRSIVIDVLSPEQLRRLGRDADRILSRIDTSAIN